MFARVLTATVVLLVGCSNERMLVVQLQSNMVAGREVDSAEVTVSAEGRSIATEIVPLPASRSLGRPVRLAGFGGLSAGRHAVTVTLLRAGAVVQRRQVTRNVEGTTTVVTLLMTRDCNGVSCPLAMGDPSAAECLGGRCVPDTCDEEHPDLCAAPGCASDADCPASTVACAPSSCSSSGVCFAAADDALCAPFETCDPLIGCVRAGGGFCASLAAAPAFCDDFDGSDMIGARWTRQLALNGGENARSIVTATSSPAAAHHRFPDQAAGVTEAAFEVDLPGMARTISFAFDLFLETRPRNGAIEIAVLTLVVPGTGTFYTDIALSPGADSYHEEFQPDGGAFLFGDAPLDPLPMGRWLHVRMQMDLVAQTYSLSIDGVVRLMGTARYPIAPGAVTAVSGIGFASGALDGCSILVDNVVVDTT